jgi:hypothetical protein
MAQVTGILCQVITGDVDGAGTDGNVYLGLGAREFCIDSSANDFERKSWREYIMGLGPIEPNPPPPQVRVLNGQGNDPRVGLPIDSANLSKTPVYIRFEPAGVGPDWNLAWVTVLVYAANSVMAYLPPDNFDNLWLGDRYGKVLYLTGMSVASGSEAAAAGGGGEAAANELLQIGRKRAERRK